MSTQEITDLVDQIYAVSGAGDWDRVAGMLTDDFVAYEADGLPMAGEYRGPNGLKELFLKVMGLVDVVGLDRTDLLIGEDCAIAVITMRFAGPDRAPAELCEMLRFRDGKCCEIKPYYYDPKPFIAASKKS
nr:nuclear transport factor 2 family protein [Novosphingobium aquimarinum]